MWDWNFNMEHEIQWNILPDMDNRELPDGDTGEAVNVTDTSKLNNLNKEQPTSKRGPPRNVVTVEAENVTVGTRALADGREDDQDSGIGSSAVERIGIMIAANRQQLEQFGWKDYVTVTFMLVTVLLVICVPVALHLNSRKITDGGTLYRFSGPMMGDLYASGGTAGVRVMEENVLMSDERVQTALTDPTSVWVEEGSRRIIILIVPPTLVLRGVIIPNCRTIQNATYNPILQEGCNVFEATRRWHARHITEITDKVVPDINRNIKLMFGADAPEVNVTHDFGDTNRSSRLRDSVTLKWSSGSGASTKGFFQDIGCAIGSLFGGGCDRGMSKGTKKALNEIASQLSGINGDIVSITSNQQRIARVTQTNTRDIARLQQESRFLFVQFNHFTDQMEIFQNGVTDDLGILYHSAIKGLNYATTALKISEESANVRSFQHAVDNMLNGLRLAREGYLMPELVSPLQLKEVLSGLDIDSGNVAAADLLYTMHVIKNMGYTGSNFYIEVDLPDVRNVERLWRVTPLSSYFDKDRRATLSLVDNDYYYDEANDNYVQLYHCRGDTVRTCRSKLNIAVGELKRKLKVQAFGSQVDHEPQHLTPHWTYTAGEFLSIQTDNETEVIHASQGSFIHHPCHTPFRSKKILLQVKNCTDIAEVHISYNDIKGYNYVAKLPNGSLPHFPTYVMPNVPAFPQNFSYPLERVRDIDQGILNKHIVEDPGAARALHKDISDINETGNRTGIISYVGLAIAILALIIAIVAVIQGNTGAAVAAAAVGTNFEGAGKAWGMPMYYGAKLRASNDIAIPELTNWVERSTSWQDVPSIISASGLILLALGIIMYAMVRAVRNRWRMRQMIVAPKSSFAKDPGSHYWITVELLVEYIQGSELGSEAMTLNNWESAKLEVYIAAYRRMYVRRRADYNPKSLVNTYYNIQDDCLVVEWTEQGKMAMTEVGVSVTNECIPMASLVKNVSALKQEGVKILAVTLQKVRRVWLTGFISEMRVEVIAEDKVASKLSAGDTLTQEGINYSEHTIDQVAAMVSDLQARERERVKMERRIQKIGAAAGITDGRKSTRDLRLIMSQGIAGERDSDSDDESDEGNTGWRRLLMCNDIRELTRALTTDSKAKFNNDYFKRWGERTNPDKEKGSKEMTWALSKVAKGEYKAKPGGGHGR